MVKIAIPNKGRLYGGTLEVLSRTGIALVEREERTLYADTTDPDIGVVLLRAADIPRFVERGSADLGITGRDIVVDSGADVEELVDLQFGKADIIVAASEDSKVRSVEDVKPNSRVATKLVNITKKYFERIGKPVNIVEVSGAVEVIPYMGVADLIVDVMSTGATLNAHRLRLIDTVMGSSARLIANKGSLKTKRRKIDEIALAMESVVAARGKRLIMMNVPERTLKAVTKVLPAMSGPTLAKVAAKEPMWEVYSVVSVDDVYNIINRVKRAGARDIIVLPIERIVK